MNDLSPYLAPVLPMEPPTDRKYCRKLVSDGEEALEAVGGAFEELALEGFLSDITRAEAWELIEALKGLLPEVE